MKWMMFIFFMSVYIFTSAHFRVQLNLFSRRLNLFELNTSLIEKNSSLCLRYFAIFADFLIARWSSENQTKTSLSFNLMIEDEWSRSSSCLLETLSSNQWSFSLKKKSRKYERSNELILSTSSLITSGLTTIWNSFDYEKFFTRKQSIWKIVNC